MVNKEYLYLFILKKKPFIYTRIKNLVKTDWFLFSEGVIPNSSLNRRERSEKPA